MSNCLLLWHLIIKTREAPNLIKNSIMLNVTALAASKALCNYVQHIKLFKMPLNAQSMPSYVSFNHMYICHYDDQASCFHVNILNTIWRVPDFYVFTISVHQNIANWGQFHKININTVNVSMSLLKAVLLTQ